MNERVRLIINAMNGRQASAVNDYELRDALRYKLSALAETAGRPLTSQMLAGITAAVQRTAAKTILFEKEVLLAMDFGAAGYLDESKKTITQTNCASWVTAYAVCGDRRAAQEQISLDAARDRRRADAVEAEERRRDFQENWLTRAWTSFIESGGWPFREGYSSTLYDLIGKQAIQALLASDKRAQAKLDAISSIRRDYPHKYRTAPESEIEATPIFLMYGKARLVRAYFETLRDMGMDPRTMQAPDEFPA